MKRKLEKLSPAKMGFSDFETYKFLASMRKNNFRWNSEKYRIILDCGYYKEKEVTSSAKIFCPRPVAAVFGFEKDLKLLG